jgi:putative chitinase
VPIDRDKFFARARASVFHGDMSQSQVDGTNDLLDAFEAYYAPQEGDVRWLAYELATAFHETAFTMLPVAEIGRGHSRPYGKPDPDTKQIYYGRGYVQLTWKYNYAKMSTICGVDLVANPDLALRPDLAAKIMLYGMSMGSFTGRKLADYITPHSIDFLSARAIINGKDCEAQIAAYARNFLAALS